VNLFIFSTQGVDAETEVLFLQSHEHRNLIPSAQDAQIPLDNPRHFVEKLKFHLHLFASLSIMTLKYLIIKSNIN